MEGTVDFKGCITHGPWGGSQGKEWVYKPEGFIRKIIVKYGDVVDFIEFQTHCSKGEIQSSCFGVNYNIKSDTISINYPLEYLVSISGTFGEYHKSGIVVKSICFKTNVTSYGPYGTNSGAAFSYEGEGGKIIGFHGRDDKYLNAIGVYVIPESLATAPSSTHDCKNMPEVFSFTTRSVWLVVFLFGCAGFSFVVRGFTIRKPKVPENVSRLVSHLKNICYPKTISLCSRVSFNEGKEMIWKDVYKNRASQFFLGEKEREMKGKFWFISFIFHPPKLERFGRK